MITSTTNSPIKVWKPVSVRAVGDIRLTVACGRVIFGVSLGLREFRCHSENYLEIYMEEPTGCVGCCSRIPQEQWILTHAIGARASTGCMRGRRPRTTRIRASGGGAWMPLCLSSTGASASVTRCVHRGNVLGSKCGRFKWFNLP